MRATQKEEEIVSIKYLLINPRGGGYRLGPIFGYDAQAHLWTWRRSGMGQKKLAMLKVSHDHKKVCLRKHTVLSSNRYSAHDLGRSLLKIEVISRFGPVRFGPVRFGPVRFGPVRPGHAEGDPRKCWKHNIGQMGQTKNANGNKKSKLEINMDIKHGCRLRIKRKLWCEHEQK